jgi:hypothetical protein
MQRWIVATAAAALVAAGFVWIGTARGDGGAAFDPAAGAPDEEGFDPVHRTIFHAVLDGLYEDGVSTELVKLMLEEDPKTRMPLHLVYTCPICDPALDALRVYEHRTSFHYKGRRGDTFGIGMPKDLAADFRSGDRKRQFAAMQKLIDRWVGARLDLMRLMDEERAQWRLALEQRRKQGMENMKKLQQSGAYADQEACPVCDGATDASKGR